jgi:hypothetical protein
MSPDATTQRPTGTFVAGLFILICILGLSAFASSQEPTPTPTPEIQAEEDPTKPVIYSLRNEYRNLKNGAWANTVLFRFDRFAFRNLHNASGARGLVLRFDVPFNTVHRGTSTKTGLGDLYAQVLYVPYIARSRRFAFSVGSGIVLPTATNSFLGAGKLIIAPLAVPIWYLGRRNRFFLLRVQNYVSVAGKSSRANVNYLVADPTLAFRAARNTWIVVDTEFKRDWNTKRGSAISGIQFGKMISGKIGFWVKPEIPWGPGRQGDFTFKFGIYKFR